MRRRPRTAAGTRRRRPGWCGSRSSPRSSSARRGRPSRRGCGSCRPWATSRAGGSCPSSSRPTTTCARSSSRRSSSSRWPPSSAHPAWALGCGPTASWPHPRNRASLRPCRTRCPSTRSRNAIRASLRSWTSSSASTARGTASAPRGTGSCARWRRTASCATSCSLRTGTTATSCSSGGATSSTLTSASCWARRPAATWASNRRPLNSPRSS
mmetsp:Transcript_20657/g.70259  ORF Transcript_20657/g.70259 Transcript_20657/m.70259 type:complete len:212 (-) Transcript_20657:212-847(-)